MNYCFLTIRLFSLSIIIEQVDCCPPPVKMRKQIYLKKEKKQNRLKKRNARIIKKIKDKRDRNQSVPLRTYKEHVKAIESKKRKEKKID